MFNITDFNLELFQLYNLREDSEEVYVFYTINNYFITDHLGRIKEDEPIDVLTMNMFKNWGFKLTDKNVAFKTRIIQDIFERGLKFAS